jgi:hypothetical protein
MKTVAIQGTDLETCVKDAQRERVLLMRNGKPAALLVGVAGMDVEQIELGHKFWTLIKQRRRQKTLSRVQLEVARE